MESFFIHTLTVFLVMFAVIDITGSIPIIINIKSKSGEISPLKTTAISFILMLAFLFLGEPFLQIFGVDLSSFAIAGAIILFFIALELVMGIEFFKLEATKSAGVVPIAFPLIAGAGSMTTLISLKSEYQVLEIIIGLTANMIFVYLVLRYTYLFEKILGEAGIQILKKIFGIILLAVAIRLFISNTGIKIPAHA